MSRNYAFSFSLINFSNLMASTANLRMLKVSNDNIFTEQIIDYQVKLPITKFVGGHLVFVQHPTECFLIHSDALEIARFSLFSIEFAIDSDITTIQFL